jgi:hypothetical protein
MGSGIPNFGLDEPRGEQSVGGETLPSIAAEMSALWKRQGPRASHPSDTQELLGCVPLSVRTDV